jgi:hypothetical protein
MLEKIFGVDQKKKESLMKEKPIDSARIQYMGGQKVDESCLHFHYLYVTNDLLSSPYSRILFA